MINQPSNHTVKAFDEDLAVLRGMIGEMGQRAQEAISNAIEALAHRDTDRAMKVIEGDKQIDELERQVDRHIAQTIALRAPMADDLRELIASLKISGVVERIGDYAKNIAKRGTRLDEQILSEPLVLLRSMGEAVSKMVADVLHAYATRDPELAQVVVDDDLAVDQMYNTMFRALITYMAEDPRYISTCTHLLFVAKNLERIGDHATNIGEMVYYHVTGDMMSERTKLD